MLTNLDLYTQTHFTHALTKSNICVYDPCFDVRTIAFMASNNRTLICQPCTLDLDCDH